MQKLLLYLLICVIFPISGMGQQKFWSLEDCINFAVHENLNLKDIEYNIESNNERIKQSKRAYLPTLSAGSSYNIQYGRSIDPNTNAIISNDFFTNNYSVNGSMDLFTGFQRKHAQLQAELIYEASLLDLTQEKHLLSFRIIAAYYDIMYYAQQIIIAQDQLAIANQQVNFVKRQIELGLKAGSDLYEAEAFLENDQLTLTKAKSNFDMAKLKLMQEMNLQTNSIEIETDLDTDIEHFATMEFHVDSIYQLAEYFLPNIRASQIRLKAEQQNIKTIKSNLMPSLTLNYGWNTGFYETTTNSENQTVEFFKQVKNNASYYYGISLNIPISQKWTTKSQIKQQKISVKREQNNLKKQKMDLYKTIQELVIDYETTRALGLQNQKNVKALSQSFKITQRKYEKGLGSILEVHQSKQLLEQAQIERLQTILKLHVLKTTLDFYAGSPVFDITKAQSNGY